MENQYHKANNYRKTPICFTHCDHLRKAIPTSRKPIFMRAKLKSGSQKSKTYLLVFQSKTQSRYINVRKTNSLLKRMSIGRRLQMKNIALFH